MSSRICESCDKKTDLLETIARMKTESEINAETDGDGMSGDDAVETISSLIDSARKITGIDPGYPQDE